MIYFDYGDSDEPHESRSALERTTREIAERVVLAQVEALPLCTCQHPYAVIRMRVEPNRMFFITDGLKSSCCALNRMHVEGALAQPLMPPPVPRKLKERVSIPR